MIIADLELEDKAGRSKFFQKIFLIDDTKFKVILKRLFLKIRKTDMSFDEKILTWKFHTTIKALPTIEQVQILNLKTFLIVVLDVCNKTFIVHMAIKKRDKMPIYSEKQAQI